MSSKFYIKKGDTSEQLKVVMKKRQEPVDGEIPPDQLYLSEKPINNVKFSMAKIPQVQEDGSVLYPDGTTHYSDGSILNPLGNPDIFISAIRVRPGETLNADYSITQTDRNIRHPNGLLEDVTTGSYFVPEGSYLLPNGMVLLPPNPAYPQGYTYNPGDVDRTNYYRVGNPTDAQLTPEGNIPLPPGTLITSAGIVTLPNYKLQLPEGTSILSTTTVRFPSGSVKEASASINRENAIVLPKVTNYYPAIYAATFNSADNSYDFLEGTFITHDNEYSPDRKATITFPNGATMIVPWETVQRTESSYTFPYGTEHIFAERKFIFPGKTITLPLSATINVFGLSVSVTFEDGTVINDVTLQATLTESNKVLTTGDVSLYDGSFIKLNTNHTILYNGFEFYARGTQKNSVGTIIHPPYTDEAPYIRYYPTRRHPDGVLIRQSDGAIVNPDGTFTKLNNEIVDANGVVIQPASTQITLFEATTTPPFIPINTQSSIITINQSTASFETITYDVTTSSTAQATLLKYDWQTDDTAHPGLYSGEFTVTHTDGSKRTFPILKDDALFIEILEHFSTWE